MRLDVVVPVGRGVPRPSQIADELPQGHKNPKGYPWATQGNNTITTPSQHRRNTVAIRSHHADNWLAPRGMGRGESAVTKRPSAAKTQSSHRLPNRWLALLLRG